MGNRPEIDMLFNQLIEASLAAQFGNIRSVKELASVANQTLSGIEIVRIIKKEQIEFQIILLSGCISIS